MSRPTSRRFALEVRDGLELSLIEHRPGAVAAGGQHAFVLVHGLASNARTWDGVGQALADAGHRAWAVDLRGHGHSSKPDSGYDVATVADDLCRLVPLLSDELVVLAGQSWGGNVVVEAAARGAHRIGAVCGVDGGAIRLVDAYPDWERCAVELAPPLLAGTPVEVMEAHVRASHPDWPASGIEGTMANFEQRGDGTVAPWLTRERHMLVLRGLWEHDPRAAYPHIGQPSLLIDAGAARRPGPMADHHARLMEAATAMLPAGELVRVPDADHDVHCQHPRLVADLLLRLAARM